MTLRATVTLALFAATFVSATPPASAELPPGSYDILRVQAEEALIIEVRSVKTREVEPGLTDVVLEARVVAAERSKAGLKKNDRITIRYESLDRAKIKDRPGPRPTPVLAEGEFYPAFLGKATGPPAPAPKEGETTPTPRNKPGGPPEFIPAAYGASFVMTPEG